MGKRKEGVQERFHEVGDIGEPIGCLEVSLVILNFLVF